MKYLFLKIYEKRIYKFLNFLTALLIYKMSLSKDFITASFTQYANLLGQEESMTLLTELFKANANISDTASTTSSTTAKPKKATKPKAEPKAEPNAKKEKAESEHKNVKMITSANSTKLKSELEKMNIAFSEENKKEFDKVKTELREYLNQLTEDDFKAKKIENHIEDFVNLKHSSEPNLTLMERVDKGIAPQKFDPSLPVLDLTLQQLQNIELVTQVGDKFDGVLYDLVDGRWVRGPTGQDDEDMDEFNHNGNQYDVGKNSGRVYRVEYIGNSKEDYKHIFEGFRNVGKFKNIIV